MCNGTWEVLCDFARPCTPPEGAASPMSPGLRLFSGRGSTAAPWRASKGAAGVAQAFLRPPPPTSAPPRTSPCHHIPRRTALRRRTRRAGVHSHTRLIRRHETGIWNGRAHQPAPFGARTALALPRVLARPEAPAPGLLASRGAGGGGSGIMIHAALLAPPEMWPHSLPWAFARPCTPACTSTIFI